jgi:hypothetical protein
VTGGDSSGVWASPKSGLPNRSRTAAAPRSKPLGEARRVAPHPFSGVRVR